MVYKRLDNPGDWDVYVRRDPTRRGSVHRYYVHIPTQKLYFDRDLPGWPDAMVKLSMQGDMSAITVRWRFAYNMAQALPEGL